MIRTALRGALLIALLGGLVACDSGARATGTSDADDIAISAARIRAVVPGQDKTAGYLTVINRTPSPLVLTGATSAQARAIEFHTIERDGDTVRMRRVAQVVVEPGASVQFAPGGLHLMIFGIDEAFETFTAILIAEDGRQIAVPFEKIALGGQ